MKQDFEVALHPYELRGGILWFIIYYFFAGLLLSAFLPLLGVPHDTVTYNLVYYFSNFIITALLFHQFLRDSLLLLLAHPLKLLLGLLLGFLFYEASVMLLGLVYSLLFPAGFTNPNDEVVSSIAARNYRAMWVGAVLLAPMTEETLTRGLLFGSLRKRHRALAYLAAAVVFALMHTLSYVGTTPVTTLLLNAPVYMLASGALCICYELTGTIWGPIVLHGLFNGISMAAMSS